MNILIAGDFVINKSYSSTNIDDEVTNLFHGSDYNIVNLEAPVTDSESKIIKTGPHLKSNKEGTKDALNYLKIDLVTLANNHILDYDEQGVKDTLGFCKINNIATVGAGKNKKEAAEVFYLESEVGKIAIVNIAENEWASATTKTAGANGMDLIDDIKRIEEAKKQSDLVFIIVHGGHEYYNLPSPRMQKQYRFYIDNGADLVVGHHTHCISGMEIYKGKSIYYSLGNFLFTNTSRFKDWYKGMILKVHIAEDFFITIKPVFVEQTNETFRLSIVTGEELNIINNRFTEYSKIIQEEDKLKIEWEKYIIEKSKTYENYWSPLSFVRNKWIKIIFTKLDFNFSNKIGKALFLNLMRCEAHADLSKEVTKKYLNK